LEHLRASTKWRDPIRTFDYRGRHRSLLGADGRIVASLQNWRPAIWCTGGLLSPRLQRIRVSLRRLTKTAPALGR